MTVPLPRLVYQQSLKDLDGTEVTCEPRLFEVRSVSVVLAPNVGLEVWAEGPLLRKDGTRGQHGRTSLVDLGGDQPEWLNDIIDDAQMRLLAGA